VGWITIAFGPAPGHGANGASAGLTVASNGVATPRSGTVTITPSAGPSVDFTVNQAALSYTISGTTTPAIAGIQISLTGTQAGSTTTDSNGKYAFSGVAAACTKSLTASLAGYTSPPTTTYANLNGNQQQANFALTLAKSTVSGIVTVSGTPVSGATININGPNSTTTATTDSTGAFRVSLSDLSTYTVSAAKSGYSFTAPVTLSNLLTDQTVNFGGITVAGLEFYPVTPCRLVDTRVASFPSGFGPPSLAAGQTRSFPIPSNCGIPAGAKAYSLNITVVTKGYLGYLTVWPAGQSIPNASTLNSYSNASTAVANAAIVPAGANGAINVYATDPTDLIVDINGYFGAPGVSMQFYSVAPCRIVDTRVASMPPTFGPPSLVANQSRTFVVPNAGCGLPGSAQAYSVNITAVPPATLGVLTVYPTGKSRPDVSTLNVYTAGTVVANAAIIPAGTNGGIDVYVNDRTDLVMDINGYFAPPGTNGLAFYPATPCRVADTRVASFAANLGPPTMSAGTARSFPVTSSPCGIPSNARAYSLNFTAVPQAPRLGIFEAWPTGQAQPVVSTMNSYNGSVVANAAIVPAGTGGAMTIYVTDNADVLFDINGYFAAP